MRIVVSCGDCTALLPGGLAAAQCHVLAIPRLHGGGGSDESSVGRDHITRGLSSQTTFMLGIQSGAYGPQKRLAAA